MKVADREVQRQLQESLRAIQVMAGISDLNRHVLRISRPAGHDRISSSLSPMAANRGFKAMRGGSSETMIEPPRIRSLVIGVTSPDFRDGKSTIAMALASTLAHDFIAEVTLLDGDFATHSVGREYGFEGHPGLTDVLADRASLGDVSRRFRGAPLTVVTAGVTRIDGARIARSEQLAGVIEQMKAENSFVVIDLPAVLQATDAAVLASRCDAVIVVARAGKTSQRELERTLELLHDANVLGVVLNRQRSSVPGWVDRLLSLPR